MKIVNQHSPVQRLTKIVFALLFVFSISLSAQDAANGKKLFQANCGACHKLDKKLVGPALKGITEKRENKWLKAWIKNSAELIKKDADAKAIFEEFNKMPMMAFPQLSDKDIDDILAYTDGKAAKKETTPATGEVDPKVAEGKKLFKTNCAACHKLDKKLVGPPLKGITEKRETAWLHAWIKDNNALRANGDALAKQVFEENNKMPMMAFPQLKDSEIDAMLAYFAVGDVKKAVAGTKKENNKEVTKEAKKDESSSSWTDWVVILVILALLFFAFKSKIPFVKIVALVFVLLAGAYVTFDYLMNVGIDQGYEPIQPIAFSHKIHAGDNKIDCQYCHSSAKHSRTSGIPTANVCMNCHKSISEVAENTKVGDLGKKELDKEIQKIYDAIGWDKDNFKYKENYKQKPIKWTRVHNLQDFVYYNHSQHVTVAGLQCQTCHGPVETYDEMKQFAPLTMRWCLDCHKSKEVNMDNKYYTKIHEELKKTGVDKATIAELGGKECGKCHY